jgi:hypothetical protein
LNERTETDEAKAHLNWKQVHPSSLQALRQRVLLDHQLSNSKYKLTLALMKYDMPGADGAAGVAELLEAFVLPPNENGEGAAAGVEVDPAAVLADVVLVADFAPKSPPPRVELPAVAPVDELPAPSGALAPPNSGLDVDGAAPGYIHERYACDIYEMRRTSS